jgi:ATP-dependent DNA ligase
MLKVGEAFEVLATVEAVSGKGKQTALLQAKNNTALQQLMQRTYAAHENYYLTEVPPATLKRARKQAASRRAPTEGKLQLRFKKFMQLLNALNDRKVTGNAAKQTVVDFFTNNDLCAAEVKWYSRVLARHLDIGVQAKTVKKIWPAVLPVRKTAGKLASAMEPEYRGCYTCHPLDPKRPIPFPVMVDPKFDGLRFTAVSHDDLCYAFTRGGYRYSTMTHIEGRLQQVGTGAFDFEAMSKNWNESSSVAKRGKRDATRNMFVSPPDEVELARKKVYAWLFDLIPITDYYEHNGTARPQILRRWDLLRVLAGYLIKHPHLLATRDEAKQHKWQRAEAQAAMLVPQVHALKRFRIADAGEKHSHRVERITIEIINSARWKLRVVPWEWAHTLPEVYAIYQRRLEDGFEGVMVKDPRGGWSATRRGREWAKIKPEDTITMPVVGYEEGCGKFSGMFGAFVCLYKGRKVNVGGKMTDAMRTLLWKHRKQLVGRKIDVLVQARDATADIIACYPRLSTKTAKQLEGAFSGFRDDL